jgi:MauM/NapG family ferredoxin protein
MRPLRIIQILFFLIFLLFLWLNSFPLPEWAPVDIFLRLDPIIAIGSMIAGRLVITGLVWAIVIIVLTAILGRFFCGHICPMGATIDFTDWFFRKKRKSGKNTKKDNDSIKYTSLKYIFLFFIIGAAIAGISSVFLLSPISIITRFYSFVVYPILMLAGNLFFDLLRPLLPLLGLDSLSYTYFDVPVFDTNLFVTVLVVSILLLGIVQSRFWCRNLCPSGAILALCSKRSIIKRSVSDECSNCGLCVRNCPMGAITKDGKDTVHSECIVCLKCQNLCPEKAVTFKPDMSLSSSSVEVNLDRRKLIGAGVSGIAAAATTMTGLHYMHDGSVWEPLHSSRLIRPPGSLPEPDFQRLCVRCGECMKGCLTNTLQPVWLEAGISGLFSPKIMARRDGCEQNCNLCGHVCPTGAIRPLSLEEKKYAKVGTARVIKTRCIAWEQDKRCLICDEICPYNAISSQFAEGYPVTVPVIDENKCNGCGYCEAKCPVDGEAAIIVEPLGELRLTSESYEQKARELGLVFHAETEVDDQFILNESHTYIDDSFNIVEEENSGEGFLPPGFIIED